jgi:hypothetical protein
MMLPPHLQVAGMRKIILLGCFVLGIMLDGCSNPAELVTDAALQSASDSTTSAIEVSSDTHEGC